MQSDNAILNYICKSYNNKNTITFCQILLSSCVCVCVTLNQHGLITQELGTSDNVFSLCLSDNFEVNSAWKLKKKEIKKDKANTSSISFLLTARGSASLDVIHHACAGRVFNINKVTRDRGWRRAVRLYKPTSLSKMSLVSSRSCEYRFRVRDKLE